MPEIKVIFVPCDVAIRTKTNKDGTVIDGFCWEFKVKKIHLNNKISTRRFDIYAIKFSHVTCV